MQEHQTASHLAIRSPQHSSPSRGVYLDLGTFHGQQDSVCLSEQEHLIEHMAIYGGTGRGKSKLLELLIRQLMEQNRGFCLLDPHGDLVEDLAAFMFLNLEKLPSHIVDNTHFLDPASPNTFAFDPFEYHGDPANLPKWLHAKVDLTARAILRKQGEIDFRGMQRLERWLKTVLYASGVPIDEAGRHLPLGDALVLLDPQAPYHEQVYQLVAPYLTFQVRRNLEKLRQTRNSIDQEAWVESTINWMQSFFSPPVQAILSCERPSLNVRQIIDNGGVILANLSANEDLGFSEDQAAAIGGLLINEIVGTAMSTKRNDRNPFYLIIDEANYFIGKDLAKALKRTRKRGLSIWLGLQDLGSMRDEHADISSEVMSQCAVQISFQQKSPADLEVFSKFFGDPNLDFSKLMLPMDRPDGYDWIPTEQHHSALSITKSWDKSLGVSEMIGSTDKTGESYGEEVSHTASSGDANRVDSQAINNPHRTRSASEADGRSLKHGESREHANQRAHTDTVVRSKGGSKARQSGTTRGLIPLARTREEWYDQGRLVNPEDAQLGKVRKTLRTLPKATAMISVQHHESFVFAVHELLDHISNNPLLSKDELVADLKQFIYARHPCYFTANTSADAEHDRLQHFLQTPPPTARLERNPNTEPITVRPVAPEDPADSRFLI